MKKSILIFGAGINQLELIREAKKLGVSAIVIDPASDPPGKIEADYYYQVEGNDYVATKAIAIKHNVDGIVTGQMEKPMRLMAKLAAEMGFIFHSPEVVERSLDKWMMKKAFLKHKVPCAKGKLLQPDKKITRQDLWGFKFPLILKPKDAFSSRGVYKIDSFNEMEYHLTESRSFASTGEVIIEEYLEGKEYSVESITYNGNTTIIQFTEKFITPFPNTVEIGHLQPADFDDTKKAEIETIVKAAIEAIGIDNSASHAEVMVTAQCVKMIEIGARLGGDFIASYLTKASTEISMDKAAIQVALGIKPDLNISSGKFTFIKYLQLPIGKEVIQVGNLDNLLKLPSVIFVHGFVKPGDIIEPLTHSAQRPACIIISGDTRSKCIELMNEYENILRKLFILN